MNRTPIFCLQGRSTTVVRYPHIMVLVDGFEPPQAVPTRLQRASLSRSDKPANVLGAPWSNQTTFLCLRDRYIITNAYGAWSRKTELNRRQPHYRCGVLPLNYSGIGRARISWSSHKESDLGYLLTKEACCHYHYKSILFGEHYRT